MFDCILIALRHYISHIKHVISSEVSRLNVSLCNQISVNHDVGDNCWTFQLLNTRNLLSTGVRYITTLWTTPTTLALYDPAIPTKISADASVYELGAALLQQNTDMWKPIAFASRSMTETEQRYTQIEKEVLALVWTCEKFANYVIGKDI